MSHSESLPPGFYTELYRLCNIIRLLTVSPNTRLPCILIWSIFQPFNSLAVSALMCALSKRLLTHCRATKTTGLLPAGAAVTKRHPGYNALKETADTIMLIQTTSQETITGSQAVKGADKCS